MVITKNSKAEASRWLVDASIYIFRAYFSLPANWQSRTGFDTEAVYGFTGFLLDLLLSAPTHVGVCFDESLETGFRHRLYPHYKSSRALPDEALAFQLAACQEVCKALGLAAFASTEYEADDLIGSLLSILSVESHPIAILSRDKDLAQLLNRPQDYLWDYAGNVKTWREDVVVKFGVWPEQIVDYLALVGDSSDDIPGVPGIGKKTAVQILTAGFELDTLVTHPDRLSQLNVRGAKLLPDKVSDHAQQIKLAKNLATIVRDVNLRVAPTNLEPRVIDTAIASGLLAEFGLSGLQKKLDKVVALQARTILKKVL